MKQSPAETGGAARTRCRLLLAAIVLLALALRLHGITWGLPDATQPLESYHPDEASFIVWAKWLGEGALVDKQFTYGGTFYLSIVRALDVYSPSLTGLFGVHNDLASSILLGRLLMTAVALVTIVVLYAAVCRLYDPRHGLLAALFLAIAPAHVAWAQRARPDELGALIVVLFLYVGARILSAPHDSRSDTRHLLATGALIGLALATRFPLALFAILPLFAHVYRRWQASPQPGLATLWDRRFWWLPLSALAAYAVASPYTFVYPARFLSGLSTQWLYQSSVFVDALERGPAIFQYGWTMLSQATGVALYALAALGLACALWRRGAREILLLLGVVPYLALLGATSWVVVRYTLPLVPFMATAAAVAVMAIGARMPAGRAATAALATLACAWTLWSVLAYLQMQAGTNIRIQVAEWLHEHVPPGAAIATVRQYTQPDDDFFNPPVDLERHRHAGFYLNYLTKQRDLDDLFASGQVDYLVLNDTLYVNMDRLGDRHPRPYVTQFGQALRDSPFELVKEFEQPVRLWGVDFSAWFDSTDFRIPRPAMRVYRRRS